MVMDLTIAQCKKDITHSVQSFPVNASTNGKEGHLKPNDAEQVQSHHSNPFTHKTRPFQIIRV